MTDMTADQLVAELRDIGTCMFSTVDHDGLIVARPMRLTEIDEEQHFWFFTALESEKIDDIVGQGDVNLAFVGDRTWVSVAGKGYVVTDPSRKAELWNVGAKAYFDGGPEDPAVALLRVEPESAQYWQSPGKAASLVKMATAALSSGKPDLGEQGSVDL